MPEPPDNGPNTARARIRRLRRRIQVWTGRRLPPGLRLLAGLALMIGGVFGFLPVLGFWMIPLGAAVAALDVMPIVRCLRAGRRGRRR
jgi:hypothetical protein